MQMILAADAPRIVVGTVIASGVQQPAPPTVYWPALAPQPYPPFTVSAIRNPAFVIRSERAGTEAFVRQIREAVWAENPALPIAQIQTMQGFAEHPWPALHSRW